MSLLNRRAALRGAGTTVVAAGLVPLLAQSAPARSNPDADIILLCNKLNDNERDFDAIIETRTDIEMEEATEGELSKLFGIETDIAEQLYQCDPPKTLAGVPGDG